MRTGDQHALHAIHLPLYKQLLKSTPVTKISSSLSRCPLPMKSGVGVYEDRGSSWQELGCSGLPAPWHEQLLLNTHLSKMTFSFSICPLSTRSGVGVCEDRWSSSQVFGCLRHPDQRYKQLLTSIHFSKMSSLPSRCPMSTKSGLGVYKDRGSSWKELGCPGHYSRWSDTILLTKSASPVSRNLTMVYQLLGTRSLFQFSKKHWASLFYISISYQCM